MMKGNIAVAVLLAFSSILWILKNYVITYQIGFLKDAIYRLEAYFWRGPANIQIINIELDLIVITAGFSISGVYLFYSRFLSQFKIARK